MTDRDEILGQVRAGSRHQLAHPGGYPVPPLASSWGEFAERLRSVGGEAYGPLAPAALRESLERWVAAWSSGGRILASDAALQRAGGLPWQRVDPEAEPHSLADVEIAILCGAHAVVENGAVALPGSEAAPRALAFLCQRLILLVDPEQLVPDMHSALQRVAPGDLAAHHYTWVSGPSKTADIEQTLVLGAHGPRALAVVGVGPPSS